MTTLATVAQFSRYLNRELAPSQQSQAELILAGATGVIQRYTGQHLLLVEDDEVTLRGNPTGELVLPQRPIVDVSEVSLDGNALVEDLDWTLIGDTLHRGGPLWGLDGDDGSVDSTLSWGSRRIRISVVYSHGYAAGSVPDDLVVICCAAAARCVTNPTGATSVSIGQFSAGFGSFFTGSPMLLAEEKRTLRPYRQGRAGRSASL